MRLVCAIRARGLTSWSFSSKAQYRNLYGSDTSAINRARNRTRISAKPSSSLAEVSSPTSQANALLHKTRLFLPRTFGQGESLDFWNRTLSLEQYSSNYRIVVSGVDEWSGPQTLVTALLMEPFVKSESLNKAIWNRWKDRREDGNSLTLEYGSAFSNGGADRGVLRIPSSWFIHISLKMEMIELVPPSTGSTSRQLDLLQPTLLKADIPILLINTITTPLSSLLNYGPILKNPNAIVLLTPHPTSHKLAQHIRALLAKAGAEPPEGPESEATHPGGAKVLFVDPEPTLQALEVLRVDLKDPQKFEQYRQCLTNSNILSIKTAIDKLLEKSYREVLSLRMQTTKTLIRCALEASKDSIKQAEWDMDVLCSRVSELRGEVEEAKARVHGEVLGTNKSDEVQKAMREAEKEMKTVMDDLTWWKMVWRVDEIGQIVGNAVQRAWCKELEHKLILYTGRLSMLQSKLTSSAKQLPMLIPSPVLQNTLSQLCSSPSYHLQTSTLITPLQTRQNQLISYPSTRLHLAGQNAVIGMLGGIVGGTGIVAYLLGSESGVAMVGASEAGTAVGVLMLCTLLGVRWAVGKWERAKKRWWEDWSRVGEGLRRDIEATLDRTMNEKVVIVADHAAEGLNALVQKRKAELEGVKEEFKALEKELVKMEPSYKTLE